jgi:hypothetical protein
VKNYIDMKSVIVTVLTFLMVGCGYAQDIITFKSGEEVKVKIIEIGLNEIKYKKADTTESNPTYLVYKTAVLMIKYENGTKDIFTNTNNYQDTTSNSSDDDLFAKGTSDAERFYKGYHGAGTGTFITGILFSPLVALIPAIACSATPPNEVNLGAPNYSLLSKAAYRNGYVQQAKHIKQGRVWTNWFVALLVNAATIAVLVFGQVGL